MLSDIKFLYVTAKDVAEAEKISADLIERKLIACVNILQNMLSMYRWQGQVLKSKEVVMILKTSTEQVTRVIERVEKIHGYQIPCVLEIEINRGSQSYVNWLHEQLK